MWSLFVIFDFPPVGGFPDLVQAPEQVQVENFIAISLVKAFDERVLVRFAGVYIPYLHPGLFGPGDEFTAEKFWAIIGSQHFRKATLQTETFKDPNQSLSSDGRVDLNMQQFPVEIVNHVEGPKSTTCIKRIAHKVGRPHLVWLRRHKEWLLHSLRQPFLGPSFLIQLQFAINAVDSLMVPAMPTAEIGTTFPETPARMLIDDRVEGIDNCNVPILHNRDSVVGRPRQTEAIATAPYRHAVLGRQAGDSFTLFGRL